MREKFKFKIYILPIILIGILVSIDQLSKSIIRGHFELYESKNIIKKLFSFTYIHNEGMAWGMLEGKRIIFIILTVVILFACFFVYSNIYNISKYAPVKYGIIVLMSGALGNMIDRIEYGYVIDFIEFDFIDFPIFNIADIYVVLSMILLFAVLIFRYSNEEFDEILGIKQHGRKNNDSN